VRRSILAEAIPRSSSICRQTRALRLHFSKGYALLRRAFAFLLLLPLLGSLDAVAGDDKTVFVPSFWDPHRRLTEPDLGNLHSLRFLTEDDYPPFHFALPDGTLSGFNVELARAICETLKISCTIQARRFDTLIESLESGEGDALIASIRIDPTNRGKLDFTAPYYLTPARFVTVSTSPLKDANAETLRGKTVGVMKGTAHEAYLEAFFPDVIRKPYASQDEAREALRKGEIEALFGDGISLSLWLYGQDAKNCCSFLGGPYLDPNFFGEGVGIAVKKGNGDLRRALNYALASIASTGIFTDLYLKYFPLGFF
jgi:polar amino acid transport system substrate-binding protein